jgi:hypothetical protein
LNEWTCVVCGRVHNFPIDLSRGTCFPSAEWAKAHGYYIKKGIWLPVIEGRQKEDKKRVKARKSGLLFADGRNSDRNELSDVHSNVPYITHPEAAKDPDYSEKQEDWEA